MSYDPKKGKVGLASNETKRGFVQRIHHSFSRANEIKIIRIFRDILGIFPNFSRGVKLSAAMVLL